jgi:ketosteroid isomerase-like protein
MKTSKKAESAILERESERCRAVVAADLDTLATLVDADLVHVHVTGRVNNRNEYLDGIRSRSEYKSVTRKELQVRVYGDMAVMTGKLTNVHRLKAQGGDWMTTNAFVTQVWQSTGKVWRQVSFHATRIMEG